MSWENKLISLETLEVYRRMRIGRTNIVATNGCFDVIHAGHVGLLREAKKAGDILVVGLNGDNSASLLKGENRPINNEKDRASVLAEFESVDYICIFPHITAEGFLTACRPDVYIKGGDYTLDSLNKKEKKVLDDYKSQILFYPMVAGVSTTKTLQKLNKKINK